MAISRERMDQHLFYYYLGCIVLSVAANTAHPVTPTLFTTFGLGSYMFGVAMAAQMAMILILLALETCRRSGRSRSTSVAPTPNTVMMKTTPTTKLTLSRICVHNSPIKITSKAKYALRIHSGRENKRKAFCVSSSIQTLLSVPESHRFGAYAFADFTAGGESHPALKILFSSFTG